MTTDDQRLAIGRHIVVQAGAGTLTQATLNAAILALRNLRASKLYTPRPVAVIDEAFDD